MERSSTSCINCGSSSNRQRRYLIEHLGPDIISRLNQWLPQTEISDEDNICSMCLDCVLRSLNDTNNNSESVVQQVGHQHVCSWCGISILRRKSTPLRLNSPERLHVEQSISPRLLLNNARVCNACWVAAKRNLRRQALIDTTREIVTNPIDTHAPSTSVREITEQAVQPEIINEEPQLHQQQEEEEAVIEESQVDSQPHSYLNITLPNFKRTASTTNHCIYPDCHNLERRRVPKMMRMRLLSDNKLFVPEVSRICSEHMQLFNWADVIRENEFIRTFSAEHIEKMLNLLSQTQNGINLSLEKIDDWAPHLVHYWLGHSLEQLNAIIQLCPSLQRQKNPKCILGTYLIKSRTGDSNERIGSLIQTPPSTIRLRLKKVRCILSEEFLPHYLGLHAIPRQDLINTRNLIIPKGLFGGTEENPKAIILADATYTYVQKSANYCFQKKSYSLHKHRNLIKPFLLVASDGYILDVWGPYSATISDAIILKNLLAEDGPLRTYLNQGDSLILDRGFRDVMEYLRNLNYEPHAPLSIEEGESQMPTIRANKSRCVTICRWVIEVVNGKFKRDFKLLRQTYFNSTCKNVMTDFRIAAALINAFHAPICNRPDAAAILNRIRSRINVPNTLADFIENNNINRRRASFVIINNGNIPELDVFPILTMDNMVMFALGTYQIKQARSYYGEHIRLNGTYKIEVCQNIERIGNINDNIDLCLHADDLLIRAKIQSRHHAGKMYFVYILLSPTHDTSDPINLIKGYCCNCIVGRRTVGCCAHVMTIVWYLGWARHQNNISAPATALDDLLVREDD